MSALLVPPLLIPLAGALGALAAQRLPAVQRALAAGSATATLGAVLVLLQRVAGGGILSLQVGSWPAPFGITLVADLFSALMLTVVSLVGLAVVLFSLGSMDPEREAAGYYPLVMILLLGVNGAFLTGDLFNLYVWFEVLLISSFVLLTLGGERRQMEGSVRYFILNLLSSAMFLAAIGILYGKVHTLNLADLAVKLEAAPDPDLLTGVAILFLCAFGLKAAVFPFFFWLPASYPTPPPAVSALFAGLLTKVGVYALVRVFTLLSIGDREFTHGVLLWVAGLSMVVGVLGAVAQGGIRSILSFHIVSQIGYMILGLGLFSPLALAGTVFYLLHHIVVKTNLFLLGGAVRHLRGTGRLADLGGLVRSAPALAALFAVSALALAGIPPSSGFWAKLILVRASLELESWVLAATALAVSLLTLLSMSKIWTEAFWKAAPAAGSMPSRGSETPAPGAGDSGGRGPLPGAGPRWLLIAPSVGLAAVTLAIGFGAEPVFELSRRAAEQLLDRQAYINAVLGGTR